MRDQQLQECQHRIEELSQKHEAAVDEGNTLRQQLESFNKLVIFFIMHCVTMLLFLQECRSGEQSGIHILNQYTTAHCIWQSLAYPPQYNL